MTHGPAQRRTTDLMLAMEQHRSGRLDEALAVYQRLHAADPRDTDVIYLLGLLCCDLGLFEAACRFLDTALALAPVFPEALAQLHVALNGLAEQQLTSGRLDEAKRTLARAATSGATDARTQRTGGRLALASGDPVTAEARLTAALTGGGPDADTLNWLGLAQLQQSKFAAAETSLRQALRLRPDLNQARNNLGLAALHQGQVHAAQSCFAEALEIDASYASARINFANTLRIAGRPESARAELDKVLADRPDSVDALNNLGAVLQDLGLAEAALTCLTHAVGLSPGTPEIRWNLAMTQLQLGNFADGWENFEARWQGCTHLRGGYRMPEALAWRGEPLRDKHVLLWAEQGFGDTLQFIRFAQDLALQGARVIAQVQPELADLVRRVPGVSEVVLLGDAVPPYDFHSPLMSLPHRLRLTPTAGALHADTSYLTAVPHTVEAWRERLDGHPGLKVGLAWAGSSRLQHSELAAVDARRSIRLKDMAPLFNVGGCSFFSLQKGAACAELTADLPLRDFSHEWADFSDTAGFVANLDLVISVDTAVAHLAGALGKPVWLLNRFDSCWRWLLTREDSPWYATLRQFRQPRFGDWEPAIAAAALALRSAVQGAADSGVMRR